MSTQRPEPPANVDREIGFGGFGFLMLAWAFSWLIAILVALVWITWHFFERYA